MKSFYINPSSNDIEFDGQNSIKMIDGNDEIIQGVRIIITTNIKEWFLNPDFGFDRFSILGNKHDQERATDALYKAILQHEKVAMVDNVSFEVEREKRKLKINFSFTTIDGDVIEGGVEL